MESVVLKAKSELDVAKGKAQELEALVIKKDQVINEQKALHNQILVSYDIVIITKAIYIMLDRSQIVQPDIIGRI